MDSNKDIKEEIQAEETPVEENPTEETQQTPEEPQEESAPVQSNLEKLKARFHENGQDFDDDESMYEQIGKDYEKYKDYDKMKENENQLSSMFNKDPRSMQFLLAWSKGGDPVVELVRTFGSEIKNAMDDPEKVDAIAAANKEYLEKAAKSDELEKEYQENLAKSLDDIEEAENKGDLSEEDAEAAMTALVEVANRIITGQFTKEDIHMVLKAKNHDADVADAAEEAEVKGRNANITAKLKKDGISDGVSHISGGGSPMPQTPRRDYGALDRFGGQKDIFERGGEKRIHRG